MEEELSRLKVHNIIYSIYRRRPPQKTVLLLPPPSTTTMHDLDKILFTFLTFMYCINAVHKIRGDIAGELPQNPHV